MSSPSAAASDRSKEIRSRAARMSANQITIVHRISTATETNTSAILPAISAERVLCATEPRTTVPIANVQKHTSVHHSLSADRNAT
jgi:hypothetical protein